MAQEINRTFTGEIPEYYDKYLGPAWFDPYAAELAARVPRRPPGDVLEIACGTGLLTRRLRARLDPSIKLVATDFNVPMLDYARGKVDEEGIEWREADATKLPFADRAFGAVVIAFGLMFFPDREAAVKEARRVLGDGGLLFLTVWDRIETNTHAMAIRDLVAEWFPGEPGMQFPTPYEMHDPALLEKLLADHGFRDIRIDPKRVEAQGSAREVATGCIRGTPRSLILEKRGLKLDDVIDKLTAALAAAAGADPYCGETNAFVVEGRAA